MQLESEAFDMLLEMQGKGESPAWLSEEINELEEIRKVIKNQKTNFSDLTALMLSLEAHNATAAVDIEKQRAQLLKAEAGLGDCDPELMSNRSRMSFMPPSLIFQVRCRRQGVCGRLVASSYYVHFMMLVSVFHVLMVYLPPLIDINMQCSRTFDIALKATLVIYCMKIALLLYIFRRWALRKWYLHCTSFAAIFMLCFALKIRVPIRIDQVSFDLLLVVSTLPNLMELALVFQHRLRRKVVRSTILMECFGHFEYRIELALDRLDIETRMAELHFTDIVVSCYAQEAPGLNQVKCVKVSGDDIGEFDVPFGEDVAGPWLANAVLGALDHSAFNSSIRIVLVSPEGAIMYTSVHAILPAQQSNTKTNDDEVSISRSFETSNPSMTSPPDAKEVAALEAGLCLQETVEQCDIEAVANLSTQVRTPSLNQPAALAA
jgi:hypothetical protein